MNFRLMTPPDDVHALVYKIAHIVYAETGAVSLRVVEAMTSMISNIALSTGRTVNDIVSDETIFDALNISSPRHQYMNVNTDSAAFKMCVRTALRMMNGLLPDSCFGATRFHRAEVLPDWAIALGYIADIDDILFYL